MTKLEYLRRFTPAERIAIRQAAKSQPVLEDYLAMLDLAQDIELSDPDTIGAVQMLEQIELIGAGRAVEILDSSTPAAPVEAPAFTATHQVAGFGRAMLTGDADGTVLLEDGRWTTETALATMGKTLEVL